MSILKNNIALVISQITSGIEDSGEHSKFEFDYDHQNVICVVEFDEIEKYEINVKESGHFYITEFRNAQNFLLKAYLKSQDDLKLIGQTIKLVFQTGDQQFL